MLNYKFRITNVTKNRAIMMAIYVLAALALIALLSLVGSFMIISLDDPTASITIGAFVSLLVSAMLSGFGVSKISGGNPRLSMLAHLFAAVVLLALGVIFGAGVGGFMNAVCYLGVAALFSLLGKRRSRRPRRR